MWAQSRTTHISKERNVKLGRYLTKYLILLKEILWRKIEHFIGIQQ